VLKSKGLARVGAQYLLPGDAGLAESLRAVRAAKARSDAGASKRAALEREIDRARDAEIAALRDVRSLSERRSKVPKSDARRYNEFNADIREALLRSAEASKLADDTRKELGRLGDGHDDYVSLATALAARMEAEQKRYEALAADPAVAAALEALGTTPKPKLGPSAAFAEALPAARQERDLVLSRAIRLTTDTGVPCALVMLNDRASVMMIVDSGASIVTLSADVAKELGLRPGKNTPVTQMTIADGKTVDAYVMKLDSVRLGPFTVSDVPCVVLPATVRGTNLLGGTFLKNFVCRMDLATQELHLTPVGPAVSVATVTPRPAVPELTPAATPAGPATAPTAPQPQPPAVARGGAGTVTASYAKGKSSLEKLVTGAHCFGNRKYFFADVPAALSNLTFARRDGGGGADDLTFDVPAGTAVYLLCDSDRGDNRGTPEFDKHLIDTSWTRLDDLPVGGLKKNTPLAVYRKVPAAAEHVHIKHGNFSGLMIAAESLTVSPLARAGSVARPQSLAC
jgi:aspartyl protease family protein